MLLALAAPASAGDRRSSIDLPAQTLAASMAALAHQAGVDIGTSDAALPLQTAPPVHGWLTARGALERLLGNEAVAVRTASGGWRVERRPRNPAPSDRASDRLRPPVDIVVLGSKRATPLAGYAGSVANVSADRLAPAGVPADSADVAAHIAGVGSTHFGPGRDKLFVRGVIDSGFAGPSQATTGQYLDDTRLNYNAPDPDLRLYDVATVEVLEGPQGTLYGAGALGGVIRIITVRPQMDTLSGSISSGVSSTAHGDPGGDLAGVLNLPLVAGSAAIRVVGYGARDGGYIDVPKLGRTNVNGVTTAGGRSTLRVLLGEWIVDLGGAMQAIHGDDSQWTDGAARALTRTSEEPLGYRNHYGLLDVTVSRSWGALQLISSTAGTRQRVTERYDATEDGNAPFSVSQRSRTSMVSNETRLSSRGRDGSGWVVGWSLLDNHSWLGRLGTDGQGHTSPRERADNRVREATLFGEAGVVVAKGVVATGGLRLTAARVRGDANAFIEASTIPIFGSPWEARGAHTETRALPSFALSGHPSEDLSVYARYQQGFRPGGFGISSIQGRAYRGDHVDTVEAGGRLSRSPALPQLSLSVAYTRWRDMLAEVVTQGGDPVTENIGDGHILALEARCDWTPTPALRLGGGVIVNHSRLVHAAFASVLVAGSALPNVARLGAQAELDYSVALRDALRLRLSANLRYYGGSRIGAGPLLDAAQGNYLDDRIVLRIGGPTRGASIAVTNLLDSKANRFAFGTPYRIYDAQETPLRPRTVRLGYDARF